MDKYYKAQPPDENKATFHEVSERLIYVLFGIIFKDFKFSFISIFNPNNACFLAISLSVFNLFKKCLLLDLIVSQDPSNARPPPIIADTNETTASFSQLDAIACSNIINFMV